MKSIAAILSLAWGLASATAAQTPPVELSVSAGQLLQLQLETPLHTQSSRTGDRASFRTAEDLVIDSRTVIPRDSIVRGTLTRAKRAGRIKGRAEIQLRIDDVTLPDGTVLALHASVLRAGLAQVEETPDKGEKKQAGLKGERGSGGNVLVVAQGGMQGAMAGVLLGRKAMLGGAAIGAGIGLASILLQRGPDLDLPEGTVFEIRFDQGLTVPLAAVERASNAPVNTAPEDPVYAAASRLLDEILTPRATESSSVPAPREAANESVPVPADPVPVPAPAPTAAAADPAVADPDAFRVRVDVPLVMVDAVVRDGVGRPMEQLRQEDFRIYENDVAQEVAYFSRNELPLAVALVVDRSGSVAPYMPELRRAAQRTLRQLKPEDEVALFAFAGDVVRLVSLTRDRQLVAERISEINAGGGTNIVDAVHQAVWYLNSVAPDRRRVVILISDNEATGNSNASQNGTIQLAMETETVIYSIKTAGQSMPLTMRLPNLVNRTANVPKMARETGGEVLDVHSAGSLDAAMAAVIARLKLRYTLGYIASENAPGGAFRRIDVRLAERFGLHGKQYTVYARSGYYRKTSR